MSMESVFSPSSQSIPFTNNTRVAVIGASGYGGIQMIRGLIDHPNFDIAYLGGERSAGKRWSEICPFLPLDHDPVVQTPNAEIISQQADYAVLSLPNGFACQIVPDLLKHNVRVIDLSADYRYNSLDQWKHVYVKESNLHERQDKELCKEAIYGLPEWNALSISKARLVASPGCFPTTSLLALLPFLKQGLIETEGLIIDAKTGTSGGGRSPKENLLLSEASESISPYGVIGHRHTSEIEEQASEVAGRRINLQFTPHLIPMVRGLLATVYGRLRDPGLTAEDCTTVLKTFYSHQPCIDVLPVGVYPATKWVRQTNKALMSVQVDSRTGGIVLMSVVDNLIKGQAGQAIQCLNLMAGYNQETGLNIKGFYP